ncbi:Proteasome subunit alpha type-5 [Sparganum proliferum]
MAKLQKLKTNRRIGGKRAKGDGKKEDGKGRVKVAELSLRNSQLWESRLALSESQQKAFRKKNKELAEQIYGLQELVYNSEKDIVNVIAYLKDIDETKSVKIVELQAELRTRKNAYEQERDELDSRLRDRVQQLSDELTEKEEIVRSQWQKLESLREFLEKRQQLEAEILKLRLELRTQKLCCEEKIKLLELKFYTDKKKMEASFEKTVEDITRRAHHQATAHLMKAAQIALKQNTELREDLELQNERASALSVRLEESEDRSSKRQIIIEELEAAVFEHQQKLNTLMEENGELRTETKELRELVGRLKKQASEQDTRVRIQLEHCNQEAAARLQQMSEEVRLEKLRAARIKALGEKIVQERSAIEVFLLSALREVREEINKTRKDYAKAAEKAFRHQMVLANRDESNYPRIRTFKRGLPNSTNSVFKDFEAAETPTLTSDSQLSLSDLTLEQKEQVLRRLFEKINASRTKPLQPVPRLLQEDKPNNRTSPVQSILPALVSGSPNQRYADDDGDSTTMTTKLSPVSISPAEVTVQPSAVHANAGWPDETPHTSDDTRGEEQQRGTENTSRTSDDCPASEEIQIGLKLETKPVGLQVTDDGLVAFEAEKDQMVGPSGFQAQLPQTLTGRPLMVEGSKIDRLSVSTADLHDASVGLGSTGIGIKTPEGVVLAVEKRINSPLIVTNSVEKIFKISDHIACAVSGLVADARTLIDRARVETSHHWFVYNEEMNVEDVTQASRPFGVALLFAGHDENGPQLYHMDPSGTYIRYEAKAIGSGSEGAQQALQEVFKKDMTLNEACKHALTILRQVMEEKLDANNVEMATVTKDKFSLFDSEQLGALIGELESPV